MTDDWITSAEAVKMSGYHVNHIRRLIREGDIVAQKFGPVWQISKKSFTHYLQRALEADDKRWGPKPNTPEN